MNTNLFGNRLHLSRRDLHIKLIDLAAQVGVSQSYLSKIETGRAKNVSFDLVEALAKALGVRPEYLLGWSDDPLGEGDTISSSTEGRVVYQVASPGEYRAMQQLLAIWPELTEDDRRFLIDFAGKLGRTGNVRIIE